MIYLGIDFGLRKLGFAKSEGIIANPLKVVRIKSGKDALIKIGQIIRQERADKIIMGLPESGIRRKILKITKKLKDLYKIEVELSEETLSTKNALKTMIKQGIPREKRKISDAYSAAIILQNWLDSR